MASVTTQPEVARQSARSETVVFMDRFLQGESRHGDSWDSPRPRATQEQWVGRTASSTLTISVIGLTPDEVNAAMEGDLLVVDRVSRRLMVRAGSAVVGVWNEAFDLFGSPPEDGTTVPGVERVVRAVVGADAAASTETPR